MTRLFTEIKKLTDGLGRLCLFTKFHTCSTSVNIRSPFKLIDCNRNQDRKRQLQMAFCHGGKR